MHERDEEGVSRFVQIDDYDYEFYDVIDENNIIRRIQVPNDENNTKYPGVDLIFNIPSFILGPVPGYMAYILMFSLLTTITLFVLNETKFFKWISKFIANHIIFVVMGCVIAGFEYYIEFHLERYLVIDQDKLSLLWIPLIYQASHMFYNKHVLDQLPQILIFAILANTIIIFIVGYLNCFIFNTISHHVMNYAASISFTSAMLGSDALAVLSYFDKSDVKTGQRRFFFMFGYHAVTTLTVAEIFHPASHLISLSSGVVIPASSVGLLLLRGVIRLVVSFVFGVIIGMFSVLYGRICRENHECEYFNLGNIIFSLALCIFTCQFYDVSMIVGPFVCSLVQQRYLYPISSVATTNAVKSTIKAFALETTLLYFVIIGYKLTGGWIGLDFWFALQTTLLLYTVKSFVITIISALLNKVINNRSKISFHLQALLVFGSFKSPRTLYYISLMSVKPYSRLFNYSQFIIVTFSVLIDSIVSKIIIRNMKPEQEEEVTRTEERRSKCIGQLMKIEESVYRFLVSRESSEMLSVDTQHVD